MTEQRVHEIDQRLSPLHRMAVCSCGWVFSVQRRGPKSNALAASAKIKAAIRKHLAESA
jgi:hypothetical protein